jgi:3-hydroxy-D-aspartate aldolase
MTYAMSELEVGYDVPAAVGDSIADIHTPALIIDLDAFERNCHKMRTYVESMNVRLRAHAKTHKSADIALYQIAEGGACGICCQKVSEAEALVRAGVRDVLIANEVCDRAKIERLARLSKRARIIVCADDAGNVLDLSSAAVRNDTTIEVLVEMDCGARRCGVQPGQAVLTLAQTIAAQPNLTFAGIQAYHGQAQHIANAAARRAEIGKAIAATRDTVELLAASGLSCAIVAGAGTGSYDFEGNSGVYNELQCGSYVFMDADYARIRADDGEPVGGFEHALFVLTSIMSKPAPDRAVCDAGHKSHSIDSGLPVVFGRPDLLYINASDEHGEITDAGTTLRLADKLMLIPGHCDPTCNLHDWYVCIRNGHVEALWPVTARGKLM